ncbi:MAG: MBL fold metallo-hydrolase [Treponema sp.]|nr:MBL fold metallo-hydrolase [Treponema sp.]
MDIKVLNTGLLRVNTLVVPLCDNKVFVVDPAACPYSHDGDKITGYLRENGLDCYAIILTHSHFDHITGIATLKKAYPAAKIAIHQNEAEELMSPPGPMNQSVLQFFGMASLLEVVALQPPADVLLNHGDTLSVLEEGGAHPDLISALSSWKVLLTPGHTPGSICLYNKKENVLISGDTLFEDGWGRTDMYGGNEIQLMKSLRELRDKIPAGTKVYPGHESDFVMGK